DAEFGEPADEAAKAVLQGVLVAAAAVEEEEVESAQRLLHLGALDHPQRVAGEPARPDLLAQLERVWIEGKLDAQGCPLRRRVAGGHAQGLDRQEPRSAALLGGGAEGGHEV